jgi:UDP-N-acetylmuramate dehydrogenase
LDRLGLKGWRVGDAKVSSTHANFIINRGKARAADVIELIRRIRQLVKKKTGILLEPEIKFIGNDLVLEE